MYKPPSPPPTPTRLLGDTVQHRPTHLSLSRRASEVAHSAVIIELHDGLSITGRGDDGRAHSGIVLPQGVLRLYPVLSTLAHTHAQAQAHTFRPHSHTPARTTGTHTRTSPKRDSSTRTCGTAPMYLFADVKLPHGLAETDFVGPPTAALERNHERTPKRALATGRHNNPASESTVKHAPADNTSASATTSSQTTMLSTAAHNHTRTAPLIVIPPH